MKKIAIVVLAIALLITACGGDGNVTAGRPNGPGRRVRCVELADRQRKCWPADEEDTRGGWRRNDDEYEALCVQDMFNQFRTYGGAFCDG